jgi:hypothetical protein
VQPVRRVQLVILDQLASPARKDRKDHRVSRVQLVHRARLEMLVPLVHRDPRAKSVQLVRLALKVSRVVLGLRVLPARKAIRDHLVSQEQLDHKVQLVISAPQVRLVLKGQPVKSGQQGQLVAQVLRDRRGRLV